MDLAEQLAALWARRVVVVLLAAAVAGAVFAWRSAAPERFEASSTLQVRVPDSDASDPSTQVGYYTDTVIGLLTSRTVTREALEGLGLDEDPSEAAEAVEAQAGSQPGFVTVTASADSAAEASQLADALVAAVDRRVAAGHAEDRAAERALLRQSLTEVLDQLLNLTKADNAARASLIREREELLSALRANAESDPWQVDIVDAAEPPSSPTSPVPIRDASLAFLIALILIAEAIVIRRAWRGAVSARQPARDVGEALGVPAIETGRDARMGAVAALLPYVETATCITVVHIGRRPRARTASMLADILATRGHDVLLVDAAPDRPAVHRETGVKLSPGFADLSTDRKEIVQTLDSLPTFGSVRVLAAGRAEKSRRLSPSPRLARVVESARGDRVVVAFSVRRLEDLIEALGKHVGGPVIADVDEAAATKSELREAAAAWRGLDVDVVAATVQTRSHA